MYVPGSFQEADRAIILDFIDRHGFATLLSVGADGPVVSHLPLLLDRSVVGGERLLGHVARANRHWSCFDGTQTALAIFHGPHGYVSPSWYTNHPSVPTWNYAVVHVHGAPAILDAESTWGIVKRLADRYERGRPVPWVPELPPAFVQDNLRAIVGFEMPLARIEAKFKLNQNRDDADRLGALAALEREPDWPSRELAAFAREYFARKGRS
jgi:transcriptional regulator